MLSIFGLCSLELPLSACLYFPTSSLKVEMVAVNHPFSIDSIATAAPSVHS